jgi:hypothetical protein
MENRGQDCVEINTMATSNDRTGRIPSINPSRTREALLGGLRFWVSVIKASRRARNSASGTAPCALKVRIPPGRGRDSTLMAGGIPADRGQQSRPSRAAFQTMAGRTPF